MSEYMTEAQKARPLGTGETEMMAQDKAQGGWHRIVGYFDTRYERDETPENRGKISPPKFVATWTSKAYDGFMELLADYPQFERKKPYHKQEDVQVLFHNGRVILKRGDNTLHDERHSFIDNNFVLTVRSDSVDLRDVEEADIQPPNTEAEQPLAILQLNINRNKNGKAETVVNLNDGTVHTYQGVADVAYVRDGKLFFGQWRNPGKGDKS